MESLICQAKVPEQFELLYIGWIKNYCTEHYLTCDIQEVSRSTKKNKVIVSITFKVIGFIRGLNEFVKYVEAWHNKYADGVNFIRPF